MDFFMQEVICPVLEFSPDHEAGDSKSTRNAPSDSSDSNRESGHKCHALCSLSALLKRSRHSDADRCTKCWTSPRKFCGRSSNKGLRLHKSKCPPIPSEAPLLTRDQCLHSCWILFPPFRRFNVLTPLAPSAQYAYLRCSLLRWPPCWQGIFFAFPYQTLLCCN